MIAPISHNSCRQRVRCFGSNEVFLHITDIHSFPWPYPQPLKRSQNGLWGGFLLIAIFLPNDGIEVPRYLEFPEVLPQESSWNI